MRKNFSFPRPLAAGILCFLLLGSTLLLGAKAHLLTRSGPEQTHLLLITLEPRKDEPETLPDSIALCTLCQDSEELAILSIAPELLVKVPGQGNLPLREGWSFGQGELLLQTLEEAWDLTIDGYLAVDFGQLPGLIDSRGGVELSLLPEEARAINRCTGSTLTEGVQTLTGSQALSYWQLTGEGQSGRRKALLTAFMDQCRGMGLGQIPALLKGAGPMLSTDLKQRKLLALALEILPRLSQLEVTSTQLPREGTYTRETQEGQEVVIAKPEELHQQIDAFLHPDN